MLGKVRKVDVATLGMMLGVIDRRVSRKMIYSLRKGERAEDDSELSHIMNDILIKHEMLL